MKIVWSVHLLGALGAKSDERPYKMFLVLLGSGEDASSPGEDEYLAGIVAPLGDRLVVGFAFQLGIGYVRRLPGPFVLALEGIGFIVKVFIAFCPLESVGLLGQDPLAAAGQEPVAEATAQILQDDVVIGRLGGSMPPLVCQGGGLGQSVEDAGIVGIGIGAGGAMFFGMVALGPSVIQRVEFFEGHSGVCSVQF